VAEWLEVSVPAVKSALHRARATLSRHYPGRSVPADAPDAARLAAEVRGQLARYVEAWEAADVAAFTALLKAEATFSMPPIPAWYQGRETIGALVARTIFAGPARGRWRLLPTRANTQPAFGLYRLDPATGRHQAYGVQVLTLAGREIADVITFRGPALLAHFNLPALL
jgi:RNA polymerase sigma-70 factor (ECF subfamily)